MQRSVSVTRLTDERLHFQWSHGEIETPVTVRWSHKANGDFGDFRPLTVVKRGSEVTAADPAPGRRSYFLLVPAEGRPLMTAERRLPLEGQVNFRDLGGYLTGDGRRVRWGQLFRSGDLSHLSDADLAYLNHLELKLVCDLRVDFEVKRSPDRLPDGVVRLGLPVRGGELPEKVLYDAVDNGDLSDLDSDFLLGSNRMFVSEFGQVYGEMVRKLSDGDRRPAVFHCTAGKDRAGFGAAIVLLMLGVPMETVFEDYLLTNTYRAAWTEQTLARIRQNIVDRHGVPAASVDLSSLEALFVAKRAYLSAALETIDRQYGSFDVFIRDGLDLSRETQRAFQESLLE